MAISNFSIGKFYGRWRSVIVVLLFAVCTVNAGANAQDFNDHEIAMLIEAVGQESDWNKDELYMLFSSEQVRNLIEPFKLNVTEPTKLSEQRYAHFTGPYALNQARRYSRRWRTTLAGALSEFQVDPEVIVAILLVETGLGRFTGEYHLLSVFASTYVHSKHLMADSSYRQLDSSMQVRAVRRAELARKELSALLRIARQHPGIKPLELTGSYAGAFGKSQFLPSSYLSYAVKARTSGSPDLFFEPDAVYSIANYLKAHGYRPGLDREENRAAIFSYNNSNVYVNVVLSIAKALRGEVKVSGS